MSVNLLSTQSLHTFVLGTPTPVLPARIGFSMLDHSNGVAIDVRPYMILGRKVSLRDYDVAVDFAPLNAREFGVSRYHAMVLSTGFHMAIKDLGSLHGTFLNGEQLSPFVEYRLSHKDYLCLGELELQVLFVGRMPAN